MDGGGIDPRFAAARGAASKTALAWEHRPRFYGFRARPRAYSLWPILIELTRAALLLWQKRLAAILKTISL